MICRVTSQAFEWVMRATKSKVLEARTYDIKLRRNQVVAAVDEQLDHYTLQTLIMFLSQTFNIFSYSHFLSLTFSIKFKSCSFFWCDYQDNILNWTSYGNNEVIIIY